MKYENPTCEIVYISSADCAIGSKDQVNKFESPFIDLAGKIILHDEEPPIY